MTKERPTKAKISSAYDSCLANQPDFENTLLDFVFSVATAEALYYLDDPVDMSITPDDVASLSMDKIRAGMWGIQGGGEAFYAWMRTVIKHTCIDARRNQIKIRQKRVPLLVDDDSGFLEQNPLVLSDVVPMPLAGIALRQREEAVATPARIPDVIKGKRNRELARLLSEGVSYEQIAAEMGTTEVAVRQRKSRLTKLGAELKRTHGKRGDEFLNPQNYVTYDENGNPHSRGTKWAGDAAPPWKPGMRTW